MSNHSTYTLVVGALVRNDSDAILLVRHPQRGWEIPQGRVEDGEDLIAALHREVCEEAGVAITLGPLAAIWTKVNTPPALIFNFLAAHAAGEPIAEAECLEAGWFPPETARELVTHPVNRDRLALLLDNKGEIAYRTYTSGPYRIVHETSFCAVPAVLPFVRTD